MQANPTHASLVTVGDSFTEGMSDLLPDGSYRGLGRPPRRPDGRPVPRFPGTRTSRCARKLIGQIVDEQVDVAAAMEPT
ncbi:hypothetical protein LV779_24335 [Streptomyces thinghirensis]|nr:hypothetical protein [Streptomyces thinghirensis]